MPFQSRLNRPSNAVEAKAGHRRHNLSGTPSKFHSDPGSRTLVLARLNTMTSKDIALAAAATFPPDHRKWMSSIQHF